MDRAPHELNKLIKLRDFLDQHRVGRSDSICIIKPETMRRITQNIIHGDLRIKPERRAQLVEMILSIYHGRSSSEIGLMKKDYEPIANCMKYGMREIGMPPKYVNKIGLSSVRSSYYIIFVAPQTWPDANIETICLQSNLTLI